jgi:cysteine-rich repeat protein
MRALAFLVPIVVASAVAACGVDLPSDLFTETQMDAQADIRAQADVNAPPLPPRDASLEANVDAGSQPDAALVCSPGEKKDCYNGPAGTMGQGACKAGSQTCLPTGLGFGPCEGQIVPLSEDCKTPVDEDCNGIINNGCESCGDGIVQAPEECDDKNSINTDNCTNGCKVPKCGDNIVQTGEQCDDGNRVDNDACTNACKNPVCGDNIVQSGEECDDGNKTNGDACTNACKSAKCGDNIVQAGEQCDDGNISGQDGRCVGGPRAGQTCGTGNPCPGQPRSISFRAYGNLESPALTTNAQVQLMGNNAHRMLVVAIGGEADTGEGNATTLTFDGVPMKLAIRSVTATDPRAFSTIYYLSEPDLPRAGTYDLALELDGLTGVVVHVLQLDDVADKAPEATKAGQDTAGNQTISTSFAAATAGSRVVDVVTTGVELNPGFSTTSGQTRQGRRTGLSTSSALATYTPSNTNPRGYDWTCNANASGSCNRIAHALAAFAPYADPVVCSGCNATCQNY